MATFTKLAARQVRKVFQAVGNPDAGLGLSQWLSLFELRLKVSVRVALTETEDPFSSQKTILSKGDILTQLEPDFEREGMQRAKVQCPHLALEGYVTLRANRGTVHVQSFPQDLENLALAEPVDLARSAAAAVTEKELKLQDEAMDRGLGLLPKSEENSSSGSARAKVLARGRAPAGARHEENARGSARAKAPARTRAPAAARLLRNRRTPAVPSGTPGRRRYDSEKVHKDRISPTRLIFVPAAVQYLFNIPATLEVVTSALFSWQSRGMKPFTKVYRKPQYPFRKLYLSP